MRTVFSAAATLVLMGSAALAGPCEDLVAANKAALEARLEAVVHEAEMRVYFSGFASRQADPEKLASAITEAIEPMIYSAISDYQDGLKRISTPCPQ